ncbi:MAG: hypothetical protein ACP5G7_01535 [Anaerolineae bacterium]
MKEGQLVAADTVVARAEARHQLRVLNVAESLGVAPAGMTPHLRVKSGDSVAAGDVIAEATRWWLWHRRVTAPVDGRVQLVRDGFVFLRTSRPAEELTANLPGLVQQVHPGRGVTIVTSAAHLRASWGSSGHGIGPLTLLQGDDDGWLAPGQVGPRQRGAILVARRARDPEVIQRAVACLVQGLVVGSMPQPVARQCEELGLPALATEGFGETPMPDVVFDGLKEFRQKGAVLFGSEPHTGLQAELIVPRARIPRSALVPYHQVSVGTIVRVTAGPHRGAIGLVSEVPSGLVRTDLGDWVEGVFVRVGRGERVFAALSNVRVLVNDT